MGVRTMPGGRLVATAPVKLLIMNAYGLQRSEIVGGPDWIDTDLYEVNAKTEENAGRGQLMLMLQELLEDRFQMKAHRETREITAYALVVAKKGPKLGAPKEPGCVDDDTAAPSTLSDVAAVPCGHIRISPSPSGVRMEGNRVGMSELIRVLAVALNQAILDRTNLPGTFDVRLRFIDEVPGAPPSDSPDRPYSTPSRSNSVSSSNPPEDRSNSWSSIASRAPRRIELLLRGQERKLPLVATATYTLPRVRAGNTMCPGSIFRAAHHSRYSRP